MMFFELMIIAVATLSIVATLGMTINMKGGRK